MTKSNSEMPTADYRPLPPAPEACLTRPYPSSQKGGTLIAEDVVDLATHERRLGAPDLYRPEACLRCGSAVHLHDLRPRLLLGRAEGSTEVVRFRCAAREQCGAAWQIVPRFLARYLWRSWETVQGALEARAGSSVPATTRRRWAARLATTARVLVVTLFTSDEPLGTKVATAVGLDGSRLDLVQEYARAAAPDPGACLAEIGAWVHRLAPGVRLM